MLVPLAGSDRVRKTNALQQGEAAVRPADMELEQDGPGDRSAREAGQGFVQRDCTVCEAPLCGLLRMEVPPRQRVLARGERLSARVCRKLWTVLEGLVALCTTLPDGRRQILSLSVAGDVVCPVSGVDGSEVWIEALTASELCELDLGAGAEAAAQPKWDGALGGELFRVAHSQVKSLSAHLVALGRLDGMERVCLFLADMAWRVGDRTPGGWRVRLPLSREDIADYLGLNPETVSRILSRVKKARLATFLSPTEYLVPDIAALQERAPLAPPNAAAQSKGGESNGAGTPEPELHLV